MALILASFLIYLFLIDRVRRDRIHWHSEAETTAMTKAIRMNFYGSSTFLYNLLYYGEA